MAGMFPTTSLAAACSLDVRRFTLVGVWHPVLHSAMPTTRPRHYVTETEDLAAALDVAAAHWPGLTRAQLLVRLALSAAEPLGAQDQRDRRLAAARRLTGSVRYPTDYLDRLREDWPK